jgi:hypothetical protein
MAPLGLAAEAPPGMRNSYLKHRRRDFCVGCSAVRVVVCCLPTQSQVVSALGEWAEALWYSRPVASQTPAEVMVVLGICTLSED